MVLHKILALLLISTAAWASEPLSKADFAYGIEASLDAHQLYEFTVNDLLYQYLQHEDLRDLRIFDERGAMLPIKIVTPIQTSHSEIVSHPEQHALVFFPVIENSQQPSPDLNVYVQRNNDGTIVNINSTPVEPQQQTNTYYIVDLGEKPDMGIEALEFDWNADAVSKVTVDVQTSDDLTRWQLSGEGAVFQLRHNQQFLSRKYIDVKNVKRYLKIRMDHAALVELKSLINKTAITRLAPQIGWATLVKQTQTQFYYRIPGKFPIDTLRIFPQQDDAIYSIQLRSGKQIDLTNRLYYSGSVYNLTMGDTLFTADPITLAGDQDRYWRIDITESNQPNMMPPKLEFAYFPHRVRFLSNLAGRYIIAFGSGTVNSLSPSLPSSTDSDSSSVKMLALGEVQALSGEQKLTSPPAPKSYKKLILWIVLGLVLVVMGFMVFRLTRHMRET